MSSGKVASQTAHTAVSLYIKAKKASKKHLIFLNEIDTWLFTGQPKIVVKGLNESMLLNIEKQAKHANLLYHTTHDAGRTQIASGSLTCLGIFGKNEELDRITGSLCLY
ncbi:peptidyl-tRNA hydrolase mitochondrial [Brachionus plicatilis]|uniref:peptidyl-tRNA hydrolase n=1 Tax=Brachionus plicatilis TaxID=10195 RepID=A0A3M7T1P7_BRAPC|nr:peptidyl-tRNA hydrolase mitochondrial [Brachionus plicatilis]